LTQSKKQQQNSIALVFRFAVAGIFYFKWGSRPKPWAVLCAVYLASGCAYSFAFYVYFKAFKSF